MRIAIWVYIVAYAVAWLGLVVAAKAVDEAGVSDEGDDDPRWERILDGVLITIGFLGMLLYQSSGEMLAVRAVWRFVAPGLVLVHLALHARTAVEFLRDRKDSDADRFSVWAGGVFTLVLLGPSLVLNLLFAYR